MVTSLGLYPKNLFILASVLAAPYMYGDLERKVHDDLTYLKAPSKVSFVAISY